MKNTFPGYYRPAEDELSKMWENCLFVLDANVLLNLYRYSTETKGELLDILKEISDRVWVPHQAALEYHRNRLDVIEQQVAAYDNVLRILSDSRKRLENDLRSLTGKGRHPFIDADNLLERITVAFTKIEEEMKALSQQHPDLIDQDPFRDTITELLEGKIGSPYTTERIGEIYKAGKARYESKIPPGFLDSQKGDTRQYSDLVLWFQIIDRAKGAERPIILVTDDRKDDWWLRFKGRTIGPRPELINEIVSETRVSFYMYSTDPFMEHTQEYLKRRISKQAIEEVREIRQRDEEYTKVAYLARAPLFPFETQDALRVGMGLSNKALEEIRAAGRYPIETINAIRVGMGLSNETLEAIRATGRYPFETLVGKAIGMQLSNEILEAIREGTRPKYEILEAIKAVSRHPHEVSEATRQMEEEAEKSDEEADGKLSIGEN